MKVHNNEENFCTIAQLFIQHLQIVNSDIHQCKKDGMHSRMCRTFLDDNDGEVLKWLN